MEDFENVCQSMEKLTKVRFAYDPKITLAERKKLTIFEFSLSDQTSTDILTKPEER